MQTAAEVLKKAADHGVSMYAACKRSGINQSTVQRWKNAEHEPMPATLERFSAAVDALIAERAQ